MVGLGLFVLLLNVIDHRLKCLTVLAKMVRPFLRGKTGAKLNLKIMLKSCILATNASLTNCAKSKNFRQVNVVLFL